MQAGGRHFNFLFVFRSALFLPCSPLSVSTWFVSFPSMMGVVVSGVAWGDMLWAGVRRDLASCSSVPFYLSVPSLRVRLISPYRLWAGCVRRFCQLVFLTHCVRLRSSPFIIRWRWGVSFSLSSRLSSRRLVSLGVSWLFFAARPSSRLSHQFVQRLVKQFVLVSLGRLARRLVGRLVRRSGFPSCSSFLGVSLCLAHRFPSRSLVSFWRLVKQSAFSRFALRPVYRLARGVSWPWGRAAVRLSYLMAACSRPHCLPSWNPIWRWRRRDGRAVRRYEIRAVFPHLVSSIRASG